MKARRQPAQQSNSHERQRLREQARPWLLTGLVSACVARPLLPSEGVAWLGDGHPFTMLLLLLAAGCALAAAIGGGWYRRFTWLDAAVAALIVLCVTSALAGLWSTRHLEEYGEPGAREVSPRLTINMLWEWIGLGLVYFLARQLIGPPREARCVAAVMIALAAALSAFGLYQIGIALPADRAAYAENPDAVLKTLGRVFPPGSPERARFEDRLNSSEPLATFALTNSLAGFLVPWLIVTVGAAWIWITSGKRADPSPDARRFRYAGLALVLGLLVVCLVLTKSRSAYVGLAVGMALLPLAVGPARHVRKWSIALVSAAILGLVIVVAALAGGLDIEVLSEAGKSLTFRFEYWQATLDMIAEFPLWGVGPGNFQDYYTQYKLPQASEEIRDPHNFALEVWATSGTLALIALIVSGALFGWQMWEARDLDEVAADQPPRQGATPTAHETPYYILGGAGVGLLLAFLLGPAFDFPIDPLQLVAAAAIGGGVLWTMWPWITWGRFPARLAGAAVAALAVHLLAAGGFTFPGVAGTFWLLSALAVNGSWPATAATASTWHERLTPWLAVPAALAGILACYQTAFLPVLGHRAAMARVYDEQSAEETKLLAMAEANRADPRSAEPWIAMAELSLVHLRQDPKSPEWRDRFTRASVAVIALRRHSSATWREVHGWYRELAAIDRDAATAARALQLARGAATLYPNSPAAQAEFSLAQVQAGQASAARQTAESALRLDAITPHRDKKLPEALKHRLEAIRGPPR